MKKHFTVFRRMFGKNYQFNDKFFDAKTYDKALEILNRERERLGDAFVCGSISDENYKKVFEI